MVRDERFPRWIGSLLTPVVLFLGTTRALAKGAADVASATNDMSGVIFAVMVLGFIATGVGIYLGLKKNNKRWEEELDARITKMQLLQASSKPSDASAPLAVGMNGEDISNMRNAIMQELEAKFEERYQRLAEGIKDVDQTLSHQLQEITGSVSKQVTQIQESLRRDSDDVTQSMSQSISQSISKEVTDHSEGRFQHLRAEYKNALKAMAKVVDQQMSTLQKAINDSHKELLDLVCTSEFVDLQDDQSGRVDAAIEVLRKYADEEKIIELAQRFPATSVIHVLRLLSGKTPSVEVTEKLVAASIARVDELMEANELEEAARTALQISDAGCEMHMQVSSLLPIIRKVGSICVTTNNLELTERLHEQFIKLSQSATGTVTPEDIEGMLNVYKAVYPIEKAEDMHRHIDQCMQAFGRELDTDSLTNMAELANVLVSQAKFEEAQKVLKDIATGMSKTNSAVNGALPGALKAAVDLFLDRDRLHEASDINWLLLDIYKSKGMTERESTTIAQLRDIAERAAAKGVFSQSISIYKRLLQSLPETATAQDARIEALNNLASAYRRAEQWAELAALMEDIIALYKKVFGEQAEQTIEKMTEAAGAYQNLKQYEKATSLLEQVLIGASKLWGDYGEKTVHILDTLAELYRKQSRYSDAEVLYRRVIEHQEKTISPELSRSYSNLADSLTLQKDYETAETYFKKALELIETKSGSDDADVLPPLMHLASLYMTANRYKEAEPCYKRILELKYKIHGENSSEIISALVHLGELYGMQNNFAESEVFMESALESAQRIYDHDDERLVEVMLKYAKVLKQVGKDDEGSRLRARAEKIRSGDLHKVSKE